MSSSINLNGSRIYRPGVYGIIDASSLGGSGISTGNVAILGAFPTIEQNEPLTFTSSRAVRDFDSTDINLQNIAKLAFSPSTDARVPGGADTLTFVNTQGTAQASYPGGDDSTGAASLVMKSKLWGLKGNRTYGKLSVNAASATALDITLSRDGVSETYTALESGIVAEFYQSGNQLSASTLSITEANLLWTWRKDHQWAGSTSTTYSTLTQLVIKSGGTVALTSADGTSSGTHAAATGTITVTVTGLSDLGAAQVGTATLTDVEFAADNNVSKTVQTGGVDSKWSTITEVTYAHTNGAFNGYAKLTGTAYDIDLASDFDYVGQVCSYINNSNSKGWYATAVHTKINKIPADQIDKQASVSTFNASGSATKLTARSDLWYIIDSLASSNLVTATRSAAANMRPGPASLSGFSEDFYFAGGSESVAADADFDASFEKIENSDIQIVVPMSDSITVHKKVITHCVAAALAGGERNGYVGCPKSQTLAAVFDTYASKLNSRHVALFAQEIQVENAEGELKYMDPMYGAVMLAGMQAGTAVSTPLTWKRPNVYATKQTWDPNRDANEAISKGFINLSSDTLGIRVERSVTTHLEDDNPVYSEVSANESVNTSVRDIRAGVKGKIGDAVYASTAAKMKSVVEGRLQDQVKSGTIKAWQNVVLTDAGDRIDISYEVAALEPLNFIVLTANVVRIASEV